MLDGGCSGSLSSASLNAVMSFDSFAFCSSSVD